MLSIISAIISALKDAIRCISPSLCHVCGEALLDTTQVVCLTCEDELPVTQFHLQKSNPFIDKFFGRIPIHSGASFLYFTKKGIAQKLVHLLKYKGRRQLGIQLGERYGYDLRESPLFHGIDLIIPIPLHKKRAYNRGYNQSELFAKGLSTSMKVPMKSDLIIRSRKTSTQTKKTRLERFENVDGAFNVLKPKDLHNKHILLVDDLLTTGATLEGCAKELLKIPGVNLSMATIGFAYFQ